MSKNIKLVLERTRTLIKKIYARALCTSKKITLHNLYLLSSILASSFFVIGFYYSMDQEEKTKPQIIYSPEDLEELKSEIEKIKETITYSDLEKKQDLINPPHKPLTPDYFLKQFEQKKTVTSKCIMLASQTYNLPPAILVGIYKAMPRELNEVYGPLENGSYELGAMKVNSSLIPEIAKDLNETTRNTQQYILNDICTNMGVAAWNINRLARKLGTLTAALENYRITNREEQINFKNEVLKVLEENGLLKTNGAVPDNVILCYLRDNEKESNKLV